MTTETKPAPLKVTWTRPAEIIEAVTWNTLRLKVDLGFHTWRRVSANLTEGWFGSPSEAADFVQKWVESHTELIVRTQKLADDKRSLVTSYLVQVQGKHQQTGERDDLRYDLTRAMAKVEDRARETRNARGRLDVRSGNDPPDRRRHAGADGRRRIPH